MQLNLNIVFRLVTRMIKKIWTLWAKALGQKSGTTDLDADIVAIIRTIILMGYMITNICIVAGIIKHWRN